MAENATTAPATQERPAWLPEKFKDGEALAKSYTALEGEYTKLKQGKPAGEPAAGIALPEAPEIDDDAGLEAIVEAAGLDAEEVGRTFAEQGDLSEPQYGALKKTYPGLTRGAIRQTLDAINKNVINEQAAIRAMAAQKVGGEKQLENLLAWAKENLTEEEKQDWREDTATRSNAEKSLIWLIEKHKTAVGAGNAQPLIEGEITTASEGAFTSQADMLAAMKDRRYTKDKAYRAAINARIAKMDDRIIHGIT